MECPPPGVVKLNFDGCLSHHSAADGFIIRDWSGQLIKAGAAHYGESGILVMEARALRDGVIAAAHLGIKHLLIGGDNATVIRALQGEVSPPWQIAGIMQDVQALLQDMAYVYISHVYREANMAADWLSKASQSLLNTAVFWDFSPPEELSDIMQANRIGRALVRRDV